MTRTSLAEPRARGPALSPLPRLAAATLPVIFAAGLGSMVTGPNVDGWYAGLAKPPFTPPNWLFPVAWTILYAMIALSLWRLLGVRPSAEGRRRAWRQAVAAFFAQLALNAAWSPVFFAAHALLGGLLVILALLTFLLWTIRLVWDLDRVAALLLVPYAGWVAFATLLNGAVWWLN